jgi:membrane associated rhomboid family serine protease
LEILFIFCRSDSTRKTYRKGSLKLVIPLKDTVHRMSFPSVTWMLIAINSLVFLWEIALPEPLLTRLFYLFGLVPARYNDPRWAILHKVYSDGYLSFLTNMFIHGGWLHLVGNMWFLYLFGRSVEDRVGHARFLALFLLCGLAAGLTYLLVSPRSTVPAIGASGAIAGVMAAYLVLFPGARIITFIPIFFLPFIIELSAFFYVAYWFVLQLVAGMISLGLAQTGGGIAWWGHVGGFIAGIPLIFLLRPKRYRRRQDNLDGKLRYLSGWNEGSS